MDTSQCTSAPNRGPDLAPGGTHGACPWKTWTSRTVLRRHTRLTETRIPRILPDVLFGRVSFGGLRAPTQAMIPPPPGTRRARRAPGAERATTNSVGGERGDEVAPSTGGVLRRRR